MPAIASTVAAQINSTSAILKSARHGRQENQIVDIRFETFSIEILTEKSSKFIHRSSKEDKEKKKERGGERRTK